MKTRPLNFCRQFTKQLPSTLINLFQTRETNPNSKIICGLYQIAGSKIKESVKFILPDGGVILEDNNFKGLGDMPIRLPFPTIALEYFEPENQLYGESVYESTKRILIASEVVDQNGLLTIEIMPVSWYDEQGKWGVFQPLWLPPNATSSALTNLNNGEYWNLQYEKAYDTPFPVNGGDYMNELIALFSFLNALACSNIKISKVDRKGPLNPRGMIPFDEYHVLTIPMNSGGDGHGSGGSGRSPREHMRRGHIRRISNDRTIWVNASIINGGIGNKIKKDYSFN